jgi:hypothetical protein
MLTAEVQSVRRVARDRLTAMTTQSGELGGRGFGTCAADNVSARDAQARILHEQPALQAEAACALIASLHLLHRREQESNGALGGDDGAVVQADEAHVRGDDEQHAEPSAFAECYKNTIGE